MELSILLSKQIISLFLYVAAGYVSVRAGLFRSEDSKTISRMVVYICSPCAILAAFQIELTQDKVRGLLLALVMSVIVHVFLIGFTKLLQKPLGLNRIERASLIYTNAGNLIIPLVAAVLGEKWVFYTTAFIIVQTVLIFTHGTGLLGQQEKTDYKEILLNPNMLAIAAGFFLFVTEIRVPDVIGTCMSGFGDMIGTAGMYVIGMVIGNVDLKWVFARKRPYLICFGRLIVYPLIITFAFAATAQLGIHKDIKQILLVVLLAAVAPAAAMVTQLTQIYDGDSQYASVINVMTIVFCIITMPVIVFIYEMFV